MTERRLTLKELSRGKRIVRFKIDEQTHRNNSFTAKNGNSFVVDSFKIGSCNAPEVTNRCLFVRGTNKSKDHDILKASLRLYSIITYVVSEYNRTNGGEND